MDKPEVLQVNKPALEQRAPPSEKEFRFVEMRNESQPKHAASPTPAPGQKPGLFASLKRLLGM